MVSLLSRWTTGRRSPMRAAAGEGKAQAESKRNGAKAEDPETDPDFAMVLGRMGSPPDGPFGAPGGSQYDGGGTNLALRVVGLQNNFGERVQDAGRPGQPPEDAFHRLQRACKAYGYSLRPEAGQTKKAEALLELLNCALEAPLGSGVFRQGFSAEEWCLEATKRFPELNKDGKPRVL